jgi:hypothetical protein
MIIWEMFVLVTASRRRVRGEQSASGHSVAMKVGEILVCRLGAFHNVATVN